MKVLLTVLLLMFCISGMDKVVDERPNIERRNLDGTLLTVIHEDDLYLVNYLFKKGVDITFQNYEPIRLAARLGRIEILEFLLKNFPQIPQDQLKLAYDEAIKNEQVEAAQKLQNLMVQKPLN